MKSFLEEYGFAILIAIVIITLIVMTSPIGGIIKTSVLGLADDFGNRTVAKIDKTEANLFLNGSTLTIESPSETNKYVAVLRGYQGGKEVSVASVNDKLTCTDSMTNTDTFTSATGAAETTGGLAKFTIENGDKLDKNSKYYVEIMNVGTGEIFKSDIMTMNQLVSGGGSSTPSVDLTNVNVAGVVGDFSTKGNLVTINGTEYRVLDVNGTQVKVISMVDIGTSAYNGSSVTTSFGSSTGQKYAGSVLDNEMTNFYNSLPEAIKTAIVPQTIKQSMYSFSNPMRLANKTAEIEVGQRYVYALDMDDVIEYLGNNYPSGSPYVVNKMFFDTTSSAYRDVWLRSASSGDSRSAFFVLGYYGNLNSSNCDGINEVRPAFILDLSLLS